MASQNEEDAGPFEIADQSQQKSLEIAEEVEALGGELAAYGIAFEDIADSSPRSTKTRHACASAVRALLADSEALERMARNRKLPSAFLVKTCALPRKLLDRHRTYIIAAVVILSEDYPCLSEYVSNITGGQGQ
jgi:RNA polymerase sigma factor